MHTIGRRYPIRALVRGCAGRGPAGIFGSCRWGQEQEGRTSPLSPTPRGSGLGNSIIKVSKTSFVFRPRRAFLIASCTLVLMKALSPLIPRSWCTCASRPHGAPAPIASHLSAHALFSGLFLSLFRHFLCPLEVEAFSFCIPFSLARKSVKAPQPAI